MKTGKEMISVVVPVYNTESYLERCIESLLQQSYRNLQIILVNDCSPGNAEAMIQEYRKKDSRICLCSHEKNMGLFQARLTGAAKAEGKYLAFLDSDDYVSMDYYRVMQQKAEEANADIVIGQTVFETGDHKRLSRILHNTCFSFDILCGEEIQRSYFGQRGQCFSWHTVWNKLYRKRLWDQCLPYYRELQKHVIMTEDIAFSTPLFYFAERVATVHTEAVFYCTNETASTNAERITFPRFQKNMSDIGAVFDFVDGFLQNRQAGSEIQQDFLEFRRYYSRMWRELALTAFSGKEQREAARLMDAFLPGYRQLTVPEDHFFASIETEWNGGLESIKERIAQEDWEYISFDIFDTVIVRPFYEPTDLFQLLNKRFSALYASNIDFAVLRKEAEQEARRRCANRRASFQDVTISEIYEELHKSFCIPAEIAEEMEAEEKRLELRFCKARNAGKELYDFALAMGKKVIFVSDMYLDRLTIEQILDRNGFSGYQKLFLSSEERLTKGTGDLFRTILKNLNVTEPERVLHIGDTWNQDVVKPQELKIQIAFFPKAKEAFENIIQGIETNHLSVMGENICAPVQNAAVLKDSMGYRAMCAAAANRYFDNPYRYFHPESDFNADPYLIGYYALGMYLLGLTQWIAEHAVGHDSIQFLSRDGYLPMLAYRLLCQNREGLPEAAYLYSSRKAVLPMMITSEADLFDLPVEYRNHSPKSILEMLTFCVRSCSAEELKREGFLLEETFVTEFEYRRFLRYLIAYAFDKDKLRQAQSLVQQYYTEHLMGNPIAFDMGYSGRIQAAISKSIGHGVDVLFVHGDQKRMFETMRKAGFRAKCFFDFTPQITGLIREHIFSDPMASCIGFYESDGRVMPLMETQRKSTQDLFIIRTLQRGALDFIASWIKTFDVFLPYIPYKAQEVSMPFEGFLRFAVDVDRGIFSASYFEDIVYGCRERINVQQFWSEELLRISKEDTGFMCPATLGWSEMVERLTYNRGKFCKFWVYLFFDRCLLKEKIRSKFQKKPRLYLFFKKIYRLMKKSNAVKQRRD